MDVQHFLLVVAIPGRGVFCGFCNELVGFPDAGHHYSPPPKAISELIEFKGDRVGRVHLGTLPGRFCWGTRLS